MILILQVWRCTSCLAIKVFHRLCLRQENSSDAIWAVYQSVVNLHLNLSILFHVTNRHYGRCRGSFDEQRLAERGFR